MQKEQLERGKVIQTTLDQIDREIGKWEGAKNIISINLKVQRQYLQEEEVMPEVFDFAFIKTLALTNLRQEKERLETEFANL